VPAPKPAPRVKVKHKRSRSHPHKYVAPCKARRAHHFAQARLFIKNDGVNLERYARENGLSDNMFRRAMAFALANPAASSWLINRCGNGKVVKRYSVQAEMIRREIAAPSGDPLRVVAARIGISRQLLWWHLHKSKQAAARPIKAAA
jgi:hypothetical protein